VINPGIFWQMRHVSGHSLILFAEREAVTCKKEALPAAITAYRFDVARQFMEGRQLFLPRKDMVELGADRPPFIFDRASPGEYSVVVN
jgi:hypothetical protein